MGETVRDAAQEKLGQVRDKPLKYGEHTRDRVKEHTVKLVRAILGIVLGGLAGFGLYRYLGCASGTCLITSSPWVSVVYGMILGFVVSQARWPRRVA